MVPYTDCDEIKFHLTGEDRENWMEVNLNENGRNKMPNNLISEPRFFLMVPYDFCIARQISILKYFEKENKQRRS